jgi:hypothetical protein
MSPAPCLRSWALRMVCRITVFARLNTVRAPSAAFCVAILYVFVINSLRYFAPFYLVYTVMALAI